MPKAAPAAQVRLLFNLVGLKILGRFQGTDLKFGMAKIGEMGRWIVVIVNARSDIDLRTVLQF